MRDALSRVAALGVLLVTAGGCGSKPPEELRWSEQVALTSDVTIVVDRHETYSAYREAGYGELRVTSADLVIHPLKGDALPSLKAEYFPIIVDYDDQLQTWYVIGVVESCRQAISLGLGKRPYFEYRLNGSQWVRSQAGDERVGRTANLLIARSLATQTHFVDIEAKKKANRTDGLPDYLLKVLSIVPCPGF